MNCTFKTAAVVTLAAAFWCSICCLTDAANAQAGGPARPEIERWIVMPITTELQRSQQGANARAYVIVDGDWFKRDRVTLNAAALNLRGMHEQLKPYADPDKGKVHFHIWGTMGESHLVQRGGAVGIQEGRPGDAEQPNYVSDVLWYALWGFGRHAAGFHEATAMPIWLDLSFHPGQTSEDLWKKLLADQKKGLTEDSGRDEAGIGSNKFKVYPVRTALSRFMYMNADCVLQFQPGAGEIQANDLKAIEQYVAKLDLKQKRMLHIVNSPPGLNIRELADRLGFGTASMTVSAVRAG